MDAIDQTIRARVSQEVAAIDVPAPPTDDILRGWQARSRRNERNRRRIPWAVSATVFTVLVILSALLFRPVTHQGHLTPNLSPAGTGVSIPAKYLLAGPNGKSYPGNVIAASSRLGNDVWVVAGHFSSSVIAAYRSTDDGRTWASSRMNLPKGDATSSIALDILNSQDVWFLVGGTPAAGQQAWYLYHTINGGARWTLQPQTQSQFVYGVVANLTIHFVSPYEGWITFSSPLDLSGTTVGVYRTEDGGQNWASATIQFKPHWNNVRIVGPVSTAPHQWTLTITDQAPGSHQSYTFTSRDNGVSWRQT